ncbi:MAG: HAD-IA family hydrolase [Alphaproteobacteria bacterium]|nr:HAD-IA family hydrolase [Alphaproteobacteria bacterium]
MPRPRLVLFDFDGTLVDSQHSIVQAFATACRDHAIDDVDPTAIRRSIGLPLAVAIAASVPEPHRHRADALTESYKLAHRALAASVPGHDALFPGAAETLDALRDAGTVLGIATGKGRRGLVNTLNKHGLFGHFTVLRTADDGPGKPDPFMVLSALDETGIDAADAVMIGDTVFDMAMAANAGVQAIGVGWGNHPPEELAQAGALAVVDDFHALLETLRQRGFHA